MMFCRLEYIEINRDIGYVIIVVLVLFVKSKVVEGFWIRVNDVLSFYFDVMNEYLIGIRGDWFDI